MALAFDALLDAEPFVLPKNLLNAIRKLSEASGPRGVIGGQGLEETLGKSATIHDLRWMHAKKTGALFEAALLLPKALQGIPAQDPRGKAIDLFASELGLAFQVMDDLDDAATEGRDPTNILFYLSEAAARAQTLGSLRNTCSGLEKHWGSAARPLLAIATEITDRLTLPSLTSTLGNR